jgi:hypothetical protein
MAVPMSPYQICSSSQVVACTLIRIPQIRVYCHNTRNLPKSIFPNSTMTKSCNFPTTHIPLTASSSSLLSHQKLQKLASYRSSIQELLQQQLIEPLSSICTKHLGNLDHQKCFVGSFMNEFKPPLCSMVKTFNFFASYFLDPCVKYTNNVFLSLECLVNKEFEENDSTVITTEIQ